LIFITLFSTSELFREKVLSVANIFDSNVGEDMNGSDLAMRGAQFAASARHFFSSPLVGGGLDATRNIVSSGLDPDLFNTESIVFRLMIDQGSLGLISYTAFFFLLYTKVARTIRQQPARRMYLGMVIGYITFTISTGLIDTLQNTLFMICALYYVFKFEANLNRSITQRPSPQDNYPETMLPPNHAIAS
jgi:O-antigen ligase